MLIELFDRNRVPNGEFSLISALGERYCEKSKRDCRSSGMMQLACACNLFILGVHMSSLLGRKMIVLVGLLVWSVSTAMPALAARAECPQPRFTGKAPDDYYSRVNPLAGTNANPKAAESLFRGEAGPVDCAICHGKYGDGRGTLSSQYDPPPRNFSCAMTVNGVPDGQLFWIIRFGSPGTAMPPHPSLKDEQIWQLVLYLRVLAK